MASEIIVVSGLPRSGTSMMMQMLQCGGVDILKDDQRAADADNPRGYLEFELVKKMKQDTSWIAEARGKAVKIISQLLFDLPASEQYHVLFMERDLEEVLSSQEKMLTRLGRQVGPREPVRKGFQAHLQRANDWLAKQPNIKLLRVDYAVAIALPAEQSARLNEFMGGGLNVAAMAEAVDPLLYRNRKQA